ncbi:DUF3999 domain-containing protein [Schlegelella sp. S2-27]|uniref:DUF3999 domain-containing protein n=1 Tax=Caldimonas mangrovi TaxID=2944811 RepID=A0ABT0YH20_9BURK|nr:DUF3999 family protein [Caldimonas mangrovi]MCM5678036.1 DUF3999 domain-containing protein [Caldimonas mangrovi]
MKRLASLAGGAVLVLCVTAVAAPAVPEFAAQASVQLHSDDGLHRLVLPLAVLQRSQRQDLADVRVLSANGAPVPMAWAEPPPTQTSTRLVAVPRFAWPAVAATAGRHAPVKVRVDAQGAVVQVETASSVAPAPPTVAAQWLLDLNRVRRELGAGERLLALRVDWQTPAEGSTVHAVLEASDDLQQWRPAGDALLLDAPGVGGAAGERLSVRRILMPSDTSVPKYLRLRLDPAVPLQRVDAELQGRSDSAALDSAQVRFEPVPAEGGAVREWVLDLQGSVALRRLQLELPQRNTVASFQLDRRAETRDSWQPVASFTSYWLLRDGRELRAPGVDLSVPPSRYWRLRLSARSPDVGAQALPSTVHWQAPQLVFAARGEPPFSLQVGKAHAGPQDVSLAQLIPGYRTGEEFTLPAATLGEVQAVTPPSLSLTERLSRSTPAERRRWALWAVLAVAVGLLAWLARRLMREMNAPPPP